MKTGHSRRALLAALIFATALVFLVWPGRLDNLDAKARWSVAYSLAKYQTTEVKIFKTPKIPPWYLKGVDGKWRCPYLIMQSLVMVPPVSLNQSERAGALVHPVLFPLLLLMLYALLRRQGYGALPATLAVLIMATCTMLLPYATFSHDIFLQVVFLVGVVLCLCPTGPPGLGMTALAGLLFGASLNVQLSCLMAAPAILYLLGSGHVKSGTGLVALIRQWIRSLFTLATLSRCLSFGVGMSPMILLMAWYNQLRFGSVLGNVGQWVTEIASEVKPLEGMAGLLVSPAKSLFLFSPPLILALFVLPRFYRRAPRLAVAMVLMSLANYLGIAFIVPYWPGDWAWGPRYLLPAITFSSLSIVELFYRPVWPRMRVAATALLVSSFLIQLGATAVDPYRYFNQKGRLAMRHLQPEGKELYWSVDHLPLAETLAFTPVLAGRSLDGLFNDHGQVKAAINSARDRALAERDPKKQALLIWEFKQLRKIENQYLDYWWLHDLLGQPGSSARARVIPAVLFILLCICALWLVRHARVPRDGFPEPGEDPEERRD